MQKIISLVLLLALILIPTKLFAEPVLVYEQSQRLIGSGVSVLSKNGVTFIVTARHVCDDEHSFYLEARDQAPTVGLVFARHMYEDVCIIWTLGNYKVTKLARQTALPLDKDVEIYMFTLFPGKYANRMIPLTLLGHMYIGQFNIDIQMFRPAPYPGMSGSPVINDKGQLVGIISLFMGGDDPDMSRGGYTDIKYILEMMSGTNTLYVANPEVLKEALPR